MLDIDSLLSYNIQDLLKYITTCDLEKKARILSNDKIKNKFMEYSLKNSIDFKCCDNKTLNVILEQYYFKDIVLENSYDISELVFKEFNFGDDYFKDKRFINKLVNERDVNKYRFMMNSLRKNNNLSYLDEIEIKRKIYYDNIINSYNKDLGMFKKYADIFNSLVVDGKLVDQQILFDLDLNNKLPNSTNYDINIVFFNRNEKEANKIKQLQKVLNDATCLEFSEILIDRYYEDITYNFYLDLETLIKFNKEEQVVSQENMANYLKLFQILNSKDAVDIDFYNSFDKSKNYVEEYYDDFSISKRKSYSLINDSLVDCKKIDRQKNKELSSLYGIDIYEFKGEDFYLLIHNTSIIKSTEENVDNIFENYNKCDGTSMSLISNLKMDFFNNYADMLVLGFNNLDVDGFVHIYNKDSYSNYEKKRGIATNKQNKLYTPVSLIKDTNNYNEIVYQIKTDNTKYMSKTLKPSYVIAFDKVTPIDIEVAKKFNVPIINVDREKYAHYECRTSEDFWYNKDRYVSSYFEWENKRR